MRISPRTPKAPATRPTRISRASPPRAGLFAVAGLLGMRFGFRRLGLRLGGRRFRDGLLDRLRRRPVGGGFALGGAFLRLLARLALLRVVAVLPGHQTLGGEEAGDAVGRLGAAAEPVRQ